MTSGQAPLRVALVSPTFGGYGGMEAFALGILRGLAAHPEVKLTVFFKRVASFELRPEFAAACAPFGARVQFIPRASGALWRAVGDAEVVHSFNPSPDTLLAAQLARCPVLVNVINHRTPGNSPRQRAWDVLLRRAAARRFYISDFVRRSWEGPAAWPDSEVVFPLCELASGERPIEQRRGFVFAARWIENKGLDTLVEAYAQAALDPARWPLCLIGDGPLRPRIERRLAELGVRGVTALGFLSQSEKADAIRAARWMVVPPNTREDFGLTAIEARAVGVPCIITRDGGVPEAAGREALVCEPGDIPGLAACLRAAAEMSDGEYATRARRTRDSLAQELRGPEFYAHAYRELAER
ncbi:MAG: glycosyltransferase family 4 protein [Opitutae bacterium]|nr:glycosyltransferase family 4 protein [Opitutae bacterium]